MRVSRLGKIFISPPPSHRHQVRLIDFCNLGPLAIPQTDRTLHARVFSSAQKWKKRRHSQKEMVLSSSFLSVQLQYCTLLRDAKKNLRQHSVLDWSPTSILSGPCDACLRGSDETRKVHRGMAADNIQQLLMWTYTPQTQYPSLAQPLTSLATLPIHDSRGSSKSLEWWPSDRTDQIRLDLVVGFGRAGPSS